MWYRDVQRVCDGVPVVLLGNKAESDARKVRPKHVSKLN